MILKIFSRVAFHYSTKLSQTFCGEDLPYCKAVFLMRNYLQGLARLRKNCRNRDKLLERLVALKQQAGKSIKCVDLIIPPQGRKVTPDNFSYSLNRDIYKKMILHDGMYLLSTNLTETKPDVIWQRYVLLTQVEAAFKSLKSDLAVSSCLSST